jgi:hypothetical protein
LRACFFVPLIVAIELSPWLHAARSAQYKGAYDSGKG